MFIELETVNQIVVYSWFLKSQILPRNSFVMPIDTEVAHVNWNSYLISGIILTYLSHLTHSSHLMSVIGIEMTFIQI